MTKGELIKLLEQYPDDYKVAFNYDGDYYYVNEVYKSENENTVVIV